jgi:anti-sigma B factor antagonist
VPTARAGLLTITERRSGDVVVLDLVGALAGRAAAGVIEDTVRRHERAGTHTLVANLARVRSVDAAGLQALVDACRAVRKGGGEMRLAALNGRVRRLMANVAVLTVFDTFDSVDQAIDGPIPQRTASKSPTRLFLLPLEAFRRLLKRLTRAQAER